MCLYKQHWFPKDTGDKPMLVWKRLDEVGGDFYTPYQRELVTFGEPIKARKNWKWGLFQERIAEEGVHAYYYADNMSIKLYPAVIPPHTKYWLGKWNDIAAQALIVYRSKDDEDFKKWPVLYNI
jgi:hypothetical protein